jgi:hypothetical protein
VASDGRGGALRGQDGDARVGLLVSPQPRQQLARALFQLRPLEVREQMR